MRAFIPLLLLVAACSELESEREIRARFDASQDEFFELLLMSAEDEHLVRIAPDFTWLTDDWSWPRDQTGLSDDRWNTYRTLFRATGARHGLGFSNGMTFFYMSATGLSVGGVSRGVVHASEAPSPIRLTLEGPPEEGIFYVPLREAWYLFEIRH